MSYKLLFSPELVVEGDPTSGIILLPVIVDSKGGSFAMKKAVKSVKQAYMFDAGFTLAQFIEEEGGVEGVQAMLNARGENAARERADTLTEQEEAEVLDALDDKPIAPTVEDGLFGDEES